MYRLKMEVAVSAQPPYFCTCVSKHVPGTTHDFELFKKYYIEYLDYLLKLPAKRADLPGDNSHY